VKESCDVPPDDVLSRLAETIRARRGATADASYTKSLLEAGPEKCARKFGEEAIETVIAALKGEREHLTAEAADVLYHLLVLLESRDVRFADVAHALETRMSQSGHAEKSARQKS
jgi:phosphoribosyl-ATP pyrophosphohydrolase